jgi:Polyketide cyclase / dehydrase and lipid transport
MDTFDVQGITIEAPYDRAFRYVADPLRLPEWTHAFEAVADGRATLRTGAVTVEVGLAVEASPERGTIDWTLVFPDGSVARAFSRLVPAGADRTVYSFVLLPPPVPLAELEGTLAEQSRVLREELAALRRQLETR